MKSKQVQILLVITALGAIALFGPLNQALANDDAPRGHGKRIAGSYLAASQTFLGNLPALITFNGDGGYTAVTTASAGLGGEAPWASRSPAHGTWKRTGLREITGTDLRFDYDADGNHISTPVITRILTFDRHFKTFTGTISFKVFAPDQDPLDPSSIPFATGTGTLQGRRIPATVD